VNGYLGSWKVDIGDKVQTGQLLAEIDAPDVNANVMSAQAQLKLAEANLNLARLNTARAQLLFKTKVTSQQEFDTAKASEQVNQATRDRDAALLQLAHDMQGFEKIYAPFSGTITARYVDVGALIAVGSATNVQRLFDIAQTDPVRVFVNVPQANVSGLQTGTSAIVTVDEYPGEKFEGKIARGAGAFDPASRAMAVEVDLPNADGRLYVGMYAHVRLVLPNPKPALIVANNTILSDAKGTRVVTVDGAHKIRYKTVKLGRDYGTKTEVLEGLALTDSLVQNPIDDLTEGLEVSAQPSPSPGPPTAK
jgi:RND family efflux transporter MFP subunit